MNYGFHSKHGLFFERDPDGNVIVRKVAGGRAMFKVTLDPDTWASVIASVSSEEAYKAIKRQAMKKSSGLEENILEEAERILKSKQDDIG